MGEQKDKTVNIVQIIPSMSGIHGILGLGTDSQLYEWSYTKGYWVRYVNSNMRG